MTNITLFLDMDGVINNGMTQKTITYCKFHETKNKNLPLTKDKVIVDSDCFALVAKLIIDNSLDVVISSNWRFDAKIEWFDELFSLYGHNIKVSGMIRTDELERFEDRGLFIAQYLKDNGLGINRFLVLDDTPEHFWEDYKNLVLTEYKYGFTQKEFEQCQKIIDNINEKYPDS